MMIMTNTALYIAPFCFEFEKIPPYRTADISVYSVCEMLVEIAGSVEKLPGNQRGCVPPTEELVTHGSY